MAKRMKRSVAAVRNRTARLSIVVAKSRIRRQTVKATGKV